MITHCSIKGCNRKYSCKGYCNIHYQRMYRHGDASKQVFFQKSFDDISGLRDFLLRNIKIRNGCWEWQRGRLRSGYGHIKISGKTYKTHRVSAFVFLGIDIKGDHLICHECDNPPCINPDHLFQGTYLDNNRDMIRKKRWNYRGENNHKAKLSETSVRKIRKMLGLGESQSVIAMQFGVKPCAIWNIAHRNTWKHV